MDEPLHKYAWQRWFKNKAAILEQAKEVETLEVNLETDDSAESSGDRNGFHKRTMLRSTDLYKFYINVTKYYSSGYNIAFTNMEFD